MSLLDYLRVAEVDAVLPRPAMEILDSKETLDVSESMSPHRAALRVASFEDVVDLVVARHRWLQWESAVAEAVGVDETLAGQTLLPDQVDALVRATGLGEPSIIEPFMAACELAIGVSLEHATFECVVGNKNHPQAKKYAACIGADNALGTLTSMEWLKIWRGVDASALALKWALPNDEIVEAITPHLDALKPLIGSKKPASFVKEHVTPYLSDSLGQRKTMLAKEDVMRGVAATYSTLLTTEAVGPAPVGAVHVGNDRQRIGMAVLDRRGAVVASAPVRPSGDWTTRVCRWMRDHRVRAVVVPEHALSPEWLDSVSAALEADSVSVNKVNPAGLVVARAADDPVLRRVSPEIASAIILARRGMRPLDAWSQTSPEKLGLAPIEAQLDMSHLTELLHVVRERCIALEQPLMTAPVQTGGIRARSNAPMNPMVRGIRDLRPGLTLNGTVSNVTKFGAFINIGLRQEGLVHISELSNEFVNDPNEVVQQGQQVTVRVISVDFERGRIALTMRSEDAPRMPMSKRDSGGMPDRSGGRPSGPPQAKGPERSKALQDLESLFKK